MITSQSSHDSHSHLTNVRDDVARRAGPRAVLGVGEGVGEAADDPGSTSIGRKFGIAQAGYQEGRDEGGEVLGEVGVGTLRGVELVGLGVPVGLLLGRVGRGILDPACLAGAVGEALVVGVDEDGRGRDG